mgnify:CR=1 FL=1|tara:strand:- start:13177 stop:14265 length:1089 start_codon:yes stop_codon:yes gene_type:complete
MSSIYEKSIADAKELRDIALKNAETIVLERYSEEVKKAVKTILEQDEDELPMSPDQPGPENLMLGGGLPAPEGGGEMPPMPPEMAGMDDDKEDLGELEDLPSTAIEGGDEEVTLTISLDDMEVEDGEAVGQADVRIDLGELEKLLGDEEEEMLGGEMMDREELAGPEPMGGEEGEADLELSPESEPEEDEEDESLEESLELSKKGLTQLNEELTDASVLKEANENNTLLLSEIKKEKKRTTLLTEKVMRYEETIQILKEELDTVTVSGAKLLYSNRVLQDSSLNGRQKENLVKTIKEARSMQEARAIYDALQNAVGPSTVENGPKSLSEAVEKRSSNRLLVKESKRVDPSLSRMQRLAGITR